MTVWMATGTQKLTVHYITIYSLGHKLNLSIIEISLLSFSGGKLLLNKNYCSFRILCKHVGKHGEEKTRRDTSLLGEQEVRETFRSFEMD